MSSDFVCQLHDKLASLIVCEIEKPGWSYNLQLAYEVFLEIDDYYRGCTMELVAVYAAIKDAFLNREVFQLVHELDTHTLAVHNFRIGDTIPELTNIVHKGAQRMVH